MTLLKDAMHVLHASRKTLAARLRVSLSGETHLPQQRLDLRLASAEFDERLHRIAAAAALEDRLLEPVRGSGVEDAVLLKRAERVGRQHLGPLVAVVTGRVAAREDV